VLPRAETRQVAEWNNWLKFMLVLCFTLSKDHVIPIPTAVPVLIAATRRKIGRFLASGSPHKYIRASKDGCSPIRVEWEAAMEGQGSRGLWPLDISACWRSSTKSQVFPREAAAPAAQTLLYIACMRSAVVRGPKALTNVSPRGIEGASDHDA
jgi:hypothetical protein